MKIIKVHSKYELLIKMIDLAILLKLPPKYGLREREKEFLAHTILLSNEGYAIEGAEVVNEMCKLMSIKKEDVYNYRNILKKRGWLKQTVDGFELLSALDFSDRDIPESLEIRYKLKIEP